MKKEAKLSLNYHQIHTLSLLLSEDSTNWAHAQADMSLKNQRTNGPVNAHLISWPSKAQNIQNLEKYMVKKLP